MRKRKAMFAEVTETLDVDDLWYQTTNTPKQFDSLRDAKIYAKTLKDRAGRMFTVGPRGGRYAL